MKVNVNLRLKDIPGQLVGALEPISANDGNIRGVIHHHDDKVGGRIAVNVTFEIRSEQVLDKILEVWKAREVDVAKIDAFFETYPIQYLIVGSITTKELESLTKSLESMENVASIEVRYTGSANSSSRAALVTGKASKKEAIAALDEFFKKRAEKNDYVLVRGLE
jgi:ACT domain-containing protein